MRDVATFVGASVVTTILLVITLGPVFLGLIMIGWVPLPGARITEDRGKVSDISGFDFEFSETACDVIAKDDAITVFISRPGAANKAAVFKYDPGSDELPVVTSVDRHTVLISLRSVSSIFFRKHSWADLAITYNIGDIHYPDRDPGRIDEQ
jgi:hypothetical protein